MKTTNIIEAFKEVWPLPMLEDRVAGAKKARLNPAETGAVAKREANSTQPIAHRLGLDAARPATGEELALGVLALAASVALVQAFGFAGGWVSHWPIFYAWVAKLVG